MKDPKQMVTVNKGAVRQLAMNGTDLQAAEILAHTGPAMQRLGLSPAKAFRRQPRYEGGRPCIHDLIRWLDDLAPGSPAEELMFLRQLDSTVRARAASKG